MIPPDNLGASNAPNRRAFLQRTGTLLLGAGMCGCESTTGTRRPTTGVQTAGAVWPAEIGVRMESPEHPLVTRTFEILRDRVQERSEVRVVRAGRGARLVLSVDRRLPAEAFRIDDAGAAARIAGGSPQGLLYGVGKFLRTSGYEGGLQPSTWRGVSQPRGSLRGMYFAAHFHNWYHQASEPEIRRYLEDLALWGVNAVMVIFPMINLRDWDDPEAAPAMERVRQYARAARELGLRFATGVNNTLFIDAPQSIRAARLPDPTGRRGNSGHPICPSNPEGHAYVMANTDRLFRELAGVGLDILVHWPYDEGGCSCEHCRPWGSNGYLRLSRDLTNRARTYFPKVQTVLSTWMFDTPPEGEWDGLSKAMAADRSWVDYILADAHEDYPRYPLDVAMPGGLPLLNFPEISMWGNWPWGGVGANPLPGRYQRLWDQVKHRVSGGFPYSEGIYEDLNKAVVAQFYWDRDRSARATLEEYAGYEFGASVASDAVRVIEALEQAATSRALKKEVDPAIAQATRQLADGIEARMPAWGRRNWRWEIVQLRTVLDAEPFGGGGLQSPAAEAAMVRLIELYHCQMETDDPYHHRVRPPLKRAVSRRGQL